jgi:hypothetical protein
MKRTVIVLVVVCAALFVGAGLLARGGDPDVTQARLDASVGPAFTNLYLLQRSLLGLPSVVKPSTAAQCARTGRGVPNNGAGNDWICQLSLSNNGQFQSIYTYELSVRADSCYVADGSPSVIGGANLTTPSGANVVNPLFKFYGCFDTT